MVSPLTSQLNYEAVCSKFVLPRSRFMSGSKLFSLNMPCSTVHRTTRRSITVMYPQYFYGLNPAQMDMFMTKDSPVRRQAEKVREMDTRKSISSRRNYLDNGGIWSMSGTNVADPRRNSMSVQMYRGGGGGGGSERPRNAPPDFSFFALGCSDMLAWHASNTFHIVPAVTELLVAQFMWLDYDNPAKPIYLYINSPGTQNEKMETVGSETKAYDNIADSISYCKSDVYTINCGMAFGQATMLLSLGKKGYCAIQPHSSNYKLYCNEYSSGWQAKELDANNEYYYIELLAKGTGKTKEQINEDIKRSKYLQAQAAIDYRIADKIADSQDSSFEKRITMGRPGGDSPTATAGLR
ncbi:hypothetical protein N665_0304s0017 [Sinapis alba]|nr:hypothetical protein N665_0304s0017 [Sinapis alba]